MGRTYGDHFHLGSPSTGTSFRLVISSSILGNNGEALIWELLTRDRKGTIIVKEENLKLVSVERNIAKFRVRRTGEGQVSIRQVREHNTLALFNHYSGWNEKVLIAGVGIVCVKVYRCDRRKSARYSRSRSNLNLQSSIGMFLARHGKGASLRERNRLGFTRIDCRKRNACTRRCRQYKRLLCRIYYSQCIAHMQG